MILIADSGSTKTDWCVAERGKCLSRIATRGINPFFQSEEEIADGLRHTLCPQLPETRWEAVHFYGAGCIHDKAETVRRALARCLKSPQRLEVNTDMLAAARALCGHSEGIACILGTGSNSCFYDGRTIAANVSPLGFILGDEGSGAVLGKLLVGNLLKNQLPAGLKEAFLQRFALTPTDIIDRVYRRPFPNRFLASLSPFLAEHIEIPEIQRLVVTSFKDFIRRNVMQYDYRQHPVHFTGSVAFHYKKPLEQAASETGIRLGRVVQSPMEGLMEFHSFEF